MPSQEKSDNHKVNTLAYTSMRTQRGGFVFGFRDPLWVFVGQCFIFGALYRYPSKSGPMNKHIVKHIVKHIMFMKVLFWCPFPLDIHIAKHIRVESTTGESVSQAHCLLLMR